MFTLGALVDAMSSGAQFVVFLIAVVLFVLAALGVERGGTVKLELLGWALFVGVFAWNALAAA